MGVGVGGAPGSRSDKLELRACARGLGILLRGECWSFEEFEGFH